MPYGPSSSSSSSGSASFGTLAGVPGDNAALVAALAAKLDVAGGTITGALVLNPTTGAPLTVRRNSKTCFEVTNGEQINIGRYDGVFASGTENIIGWSGKYGAGWWIQGGAGNWYAGFQIGAGTGEFRIASDAGGANAVRLFNASASSLQIGANHATTPTDQTIKAHNVTTGTGASLILCGGTGSVVGGSVKLAAPSTTGAGVVAVEVGPGGLLGFFGAGPQTQPATGGSSAAFVENTGTALNENSTFDNYTIAQVVTALRNLGLLA